MTSQSCMSLVAIGRSTDVSKIFRSNKRKQDEKNVKRCDNFENGFWGKAFEVLYKPFSRTDACVPYLYISIDKRLSIIDREFKSENSENIVSACKEKNMLGSYYEMWTKLFQMKWEIPLAGNKGKIEISLKLPHFGFPPHAFVDFKSDPVVHPLKCVTLNHLFDSETIPGNYAYGYITDDVLQATVLQRYLFHEGERYIASYGLSFICFD
jgi:hypothetical protein